MIEHWYSRWFVPSWEGHTGNIQPCVLTTRYLRGMLFVRTITKCIRCEMWKTWRGRVSSTCPHLCQTVGVWLIGEDPNMIHIELHQQGIIFGLSNPSLITFYNLTITCIYVFCVYCHSYQPYRMGHGQYLNLKWIGSLILNACMLNLAIAIIHKDGDGSWCSNWMACWNLQMLIVYTFLHKRYRNDSQYTDFCFIHWPHSRQITVPWPQRVVAADQPQWILLKANSGRWAAIGALNSMLD